MIECSKPQNVIGSIRASSPTRQERQTVPEDTVARLFEKMSGGDKHAADELLPLIYRDLHRLATSRMQGQRPDHTLQATALVNEVYLKLFQGVGTLCKDRDHFLARATSAMRSILVDHARTKNRVKRRNDGERVPIDEITEELEETGIDLLALDSALEKLGARDPQMVKIIELRFFGDMTVSETARILDLSVRSVEREWATARAWLRKEIA